VTGCFSHFGFYSLGDGQIDFEEFLKMMSNRVGTRNRDYELKEAFNVFDQDGDGYISVKELTTVMETLGEQIDKETIELMIEAVDNDGDNEIDFKEFKMMMAEGP
jgi:calmodulin